MSESSDDSVVSVIAAVQDQKRIKSVNNVSSNPLTSQGSDKGRKSVSQKPENQQSVTPPAAASNSTPERRNPTPDAKKQEPIGTKKPTDSRFTQNPSTGEEHIITSAITSVHVGSAQTKQKSTDKPGDQTLIPARARRRRNRSTSANKTERDTQSAHLTRSPKDKEIAKSKSKEPLEKTDEQNKNIAIAPQSSEKASNCDKGHEEASKNGNTQSYENQTQLIDTSEEVPKMGNKQGGERKKSDQDEKKNEKESKKKTKARKSKSPASDRESVVGNRSSIETSDSYSSAATLVATANAAVGRRSPKKSPRSLPRSGVKLREVVSSDDESFVSAGFRTPQATTPQLKRANEPTSPSQRLLEFGKNIEREIAGKFARKSPSSPERQNVTEKFLSTHTKRYSRDGIETDSDSFAMFENTEQLYVTVPKDYYPIDDTLSDDVFMSCIDLAANSPDIPARSQSKNIAGQSSPAQSKKLVVATEAKAPTQQMTLLQLSKQSSSHTSSRLPQIPEASQKSVTLPAKCKSPEKSPSSSTRFHSESPKMASEKPELLTNTKSSTETKENTEEKVKLKHSPVIPRRFIAEGSKSNSSRGSPSQQKQSHISAKSPSSAFKMEAAKSPKSQHPTQHSLKSPGIPKRKLDNKSASSPPTILPPTETPSSSAPTAPPVGKSSASSLNASQKLPTNKTTSSSPQLSRKLLTKPKSPPTAHKMHAEKQITSTLTSTVVSSGKSVTTSPSVVKVEKDASPLPNSTKHETPKSPPTATSPLALRRFPNEKQASQSPKAPRRYPAEEYSPKIKKRIQAGNPSSPVIPRHQKKVGSMSPALSKQNKAQTPVSPTQQRKIEAAFPVQSSVTVSAQTKTQPGITACSRAEEESTQIHDSPKTSKQDKGLLGVAKKKEHQLSTYDNVPDSDDSMAYFIDKNDPGFFEDNCVSEEIIATEKTPLHYKADEVKKCDVEIMKAPTKAKIECVLPDREAPIPIVDAKANVTTLPNSSAVTSKKTEPLHLSGVVISTTAVTSTQPVTLKSTTVSEKVLKPMMAVESHMGNKPIQSSKLESVKPKDAESSALKPTTHKDQASNESVSTTKVVTTGPILPKCNLSPGCEEIIGAKNQESTTEHLTKRQIRRRNKKKNLQMGGSLDSGSDPPLSPTAVQSEEPICVDTSMFPVIKSLDSKYVSGKSEEMDERKITTQIVTEVVEKSVNLSNEPVPTTKKDDLKPDHVPPPSPSANDALGGIVEEDEDAEDVDDIFIDEKAREVINFGESIVKRLSSLVESQSDSIELERRFQSDFDETDEAVDELNDSKKSCLEVLDELCDMGEKFKKEHENESHECVPTDKQNGAPLKYDGDKRSVESSPRTVQKRPSIPNELQLNSESVKSETEPKRDSQKITEVISSYGDDITPTVPKVSVLPGVSSDEEFFSPERRLSGDALRVPEIEETFSELMSVKHILQEMEDKTPTSDVLPRFVGPGDIASPPSYLTGSGRRSRMSPAITERTESELDISEQLDNVSISTDSMYADDEDDDELIISKTYTEDKGGECQVSYTFYNTSHDYDSDEFWANSSAAEENYKVLEESVDQASSTFKQARTEMHEIQRHLQDLRRQMAYLEDDVQGSTLTASLSVGSSDIL